MKLTTRLLTSAYQRGFSLIEAAIVLGVVGLVIGGIWVAAAAISSERMANEAYTDIANAVAKLDQYEYWQLNKYLNGGMTSYGTNVTALGLFDATYTYIGWGIFTSTKHSFSFDMPSANGSPYFGSSGKKVEGFHLFS